MPYLRIHCPERPPEEKRTIAIALTDAVVDLNFAPHPRAPTKEEIRARTTVHFTCYRQEDFFIGGQTPSERGAPDISVEYSDWALHPRRQRRVAAALTPLLARLFNVGPEHLDDVNIRFHPYPPTDFAVGGTLLRDRLPLPARIARRLTR